MRNARTSRLVATCVIANLALLGLAPPASAANIVATSGSLFADWSDTTIWVGGVVPGPGDTADVLTPTTRITIDAAAPNSVDRITGNGFFMTLAKDFTVGDLHLREGRIFDGGRNLTVTGLFTNRQFGINNGNSASAGDVRTGGNLFLNRVELGRSNFHRFRPGDTISGNITTTTAFSTCPALNVDQDPVYYGNRLGTGLTLGSATALTLCSNSTTVRTRLTLNWDSGITGANDWALRWAGDHVTQLRSLQASGVLVIGTIPAGTTFSPTENIFYNPADGYTYVGFEGVGDTDGDGVADEVDACPGFDDRLDADGDFVPNGCDACTGFPNTDEDDDGACDTSDPCPTDPQNLDTDNDLVCDVDDLCRGNDAAGDADGDQVCEDIDACEGNDVSGDSDLDFFCDDLDNCPVDVNGDQADADGDLIGNVCEADSDQDGTIDDFDNCPADANPQQENSDTDGLGDACDDDDDGDAIADVGDNCPLVVNADQLDTDADGLGNACDGDDDADAILDGMDLCPATPMGVLVNMSGCSGRQFVDLMVGPCSQYVTHCGQFRRGLYVAVVAFASYKARMAGLLTWREVGAIVSAAARRSSC